MASTSDTPTHDYTEGASETQVSAALANSIISRRESQHGDDADGAVFDGPGHEVNPTTVSRMSTVDRERRRSSSEEWRRRSFDSYTAPSPKKKERRESLTLDANRTSREGEEEDGAPSGQFEEDLDIDVDSTRPITRQHRLSSPTRLGSSVLENLTQLFRRPSGSLAEPTSDSQRPSLYRRSSSSGRLFSRSRRRSDAGQESTTGTDETDLERWGYSSGEEDSEEHDSDLPSEDAVDDADSAFEFHPPTPPGALPLLASDHIFGGETRIPMDKVLQDLGPPPPGPPSRQIIYFADEDSTIRFVGYEPIRWKVVLWKMASFATFGILWLLGHWFPRFWLRWVTQEKAFTEIKNGYIVVEVSATLAPRNSKQMSSQTSHTDITKFSLQSLIYPYPLSTVFPRTSRNDFLNRRLSAPPSGDDTCHILRFLDYRYARYVLNPRTGLFGAIRYLLMNVSRHLSH
jgi:cation-transporting ATPase 13A2